MFLFQDGVFYFFSLKSSCDRYSGTFISRQLYAQHGVVVLGNKPDSVCAESPIP